MEDENLLDEARRAACEELRLQQYRQGWRDGASGTSRQKSDIAYLLGWHDARRGTVIQTEAR